MRTRVVLFADEGTILTNGTDYGKIIWLAEGADPHSYHAIPMADYEAMLSRQGVAVC